MTIIRLSLQISTIEGIKQVGRDSLSWLTPCVDYDTTSTRRSGPWRKLVEWRRQLHPIILISE